MKKLGIIAVVGMFALSGCATSVPSATPTPTETESPNIAACNDFANLTMTIPAVVNGDEEGAWETLQSDFDTVALTAEGTTQARMLALSEDWPDYAKIKLWNELDDINAKLNAVKRACEADGSTATFATLTTSE